MVKLPKISFVIPVFNAEKRISICLDSIKQQDYPKNLIEILIADGGSTDRTREIIRKYNTVLVKNKYKVEEKGKPLAIKKAKGEILCFIDDDNILPDKSWLRRMIEPFNEKDIVGSETLYYTYRKDDDIITRYNALIGGDDPIASYFGINDRLCYFNNRWTGQYHKKINRGSYIKIFLYKNKVPAMGSNGFLIRKNILMKIKHNPFIHPILISDLVKNGYNKFAKVKIGIIHKQDGSFKIFYRKKLRRIKRRYSGEIRWNNNYGLSNGKLILTGLYCASFVLPLCDALIGFKRKPSLAWLFHPIATVSLIFIYCYNHLKSRINKNAQES